MHQNYVSKKMFYAILAFLCVALLGYLWLTTYLIHAREKAWDMEIDQKLSRIASNVMTDVPENTERNQTALYIVGECDGKIGIYAGNGTDLIEVLDVYLASLPDKDRQYLKEGIEIYSSNELLSIIQDYTS